MKIVLINASPKINNSSSCILLEDLKYYLQEKAQIIEKELHTTVVSKNILDELYSTDAWVFSYPLYVDGIPGHLLSCLMQLEKAHFQNPDIHIYGIVNNGFYEGIQAELALEILQNWCEKTGFIWGGGIGIGGGGGIAMMPNPQNGKGPKAPINNALSVLAEKILQHETQENNYVSVAIPRWLYKIFAQIGWRQNIKANGGKIKDLGKQPKV